MLGGKRLKVLAASPVQISLSKEGDAGQVVEIRKERGLVVRSAEGSVLIERVQPAGKRAMSAADFLRGARLEVGNHFQ